MQRTLINAIGRFPVEATFETLKVKIKRQF